MDSIKENFIVFGIFCHGGINDTKGGHELQPIITSEFQSSNNDNVYYIMAGAYTFSIVSSPIQQHETYEKLKSIFDSDPTLSSLRPTRSSFDEFSETLESKLQECVEYINTSTEHNFEHYKMLGHSKKQPIISDRPLAIIQKNTPILDKTYQKDETPAFQRYTPYGDIVVIASDHPLFSSRVGERIPFIWNTIPNLTDKITLSMLIEIGKSVSKNVIIFDFTCNDIVIKPGEISSQRLGQKQISKALQKGTNGGAKKTKKQKKQKNKKTKKQKKQKNKKTKKTKKVKK
jgi:hypothetical protein